MYSLSDNPFSYQLDKNAATEPLNSQYRRITTPVILLSKIRELKPTFAQASEEDPIFVHPNVLALRVLDDSKVFIPCLILELSKASSNVQKAGVIPSMQQSDILKLRLVMPEGKSLQEAFYLNAKKERQEAQIRELGLEGIIKSQKAEYEAIIRRRKHDLNNMLGDTSNYIDAITTFLDSKGYSDEIMDDDLKVSLGQILSHIQTSLSSMSGIIRHLDDDEVYAEPEIIDLVPRLKALANEVHRNYSVKYSADSYSLCDVVQDDDELHAWVKFGSVNLDRVFFNIIQNAATGEISFGIYACAPGFGSRRIKQVRQTGPLRRGPFDDDEVDDLHLGGLHVALGLLPAGGCLVIEVNRKGADGLREDSHAGPYSRDGQRAFRGDDGFLCCIGYSVGEKHLVHSVLEFA
jgi:hypothetical protein